MTITLKFNPPAEFFGDIMETALDSCEWIKIYNTVRGGTKNYIINFTARPHWREGKPFDEGDDRNDWQLVYRAKVEVAVQRIISEEIVNESTRDTIFQAVREADACHIDADAADAILQIAMFGEIVFG